MWPPIRSSLAGLHVLLTLAWFAILIAATIPLGRLLRRPALTRALDRLTGGVLVGFGVRLAASSGRREREKLRFRALGLENGLGNATSRCTAPSNWCV